MVVINKFEVTIELDRKVCVEYSDEELENATSDSDLPNAARYIEALPDRNFGVRIHLLPELRFDSGSNSVCWEVYLDGVRSRSISMRQDQYLEGQVKTCISHEHIKHDGQWKSHPFVFSKLDITQENIKGDPKDLRAKHGSLGTIKVQALPYYTSGIRAGASSSGQIPITNKSVSEKALKGRAVTLGAGHGDATPCQEPLQSTGFVVNESPLAVFTFHYRTKKALQDLMILPRDDTEHVAGEVLPEDDIESMTAEELRSMLRTERKKTSTKMKSKSKLAIKREIQIHDLEDDEGDEDILEVRETKRPRITPEVIVID